MNTRPPFFRQIVLKPCAIALALIGGCAWLRAQSPQGQQNTAARPARALQVTVVDENGVLVPLAKVTLENQATHAMRRGETDSAGHWTVTAWPAGPYRVRVEKQGFYALEQGDVGSSGSDALEVAIHHQQEVGEVVNVVDAAPGMDPQQTAKSDSLTTRDIVDIPYPTTRDIRNALPFIPGVLQDSTGVLHVAGAASYDTQEVLDGFRISEPANGNFQMRLSPEAVRKVEADSSRYSAQYGHASGGLLLLDTRTGDDHFRFSAVNFLPTLQDVRGIDFNNWVPRFTFSGPVVRRRAWFYLAHESEYDLNIVKQLPVGADRTHLWRTSDIAKFQANLSPGNVLSAEFLGNWLNTPAAGLDQFDPVSITRKQDFKSLVGSIKDQISLSRSSLLEVGAAVVQFHDSDRPQGPLPEVLAPGGNSGNFFRTSLQNTRRVEGLAHLYLPPARWHGRHEFRAGVDADRTTYEQRFRRNRIDVLDANGALVRTVSFTPNAAFTQHNAAAGAFLQDRWGLGERLLVEPGVRLDWDEIVRSMLVSPRIAATAMLKPETKLSAGVGVFRNETTLAQLSAPLSGQRFDTFFANGVAAGPPVLTQFFVPRGSVKAPESVNWSLGLEQRLPRAIDAHVEFLDRVGIHDFAFDNPVADATGAVGGKYFLTSERRNHYRALQLAARHDFSRHHVVYGAYTRSRASTSQALDVGFDNPVFGRQMPGPLPWDAPNRAVSWGFLPAPRLWRWSFDKWDLAYSLEWRSGFPFSLVNAEQQLLGLPNQHRFPYFLAINPALERRIRFHGYLWALRGGMDNVTGRLNPTVVDNNINSPTFLTFSGERGRSFNGRIRFLGKEAAP